MSGFFENMSGTFLNYVHEIVEFCAIRLKNHDNIFWKGA